MHIGGGAWPADLTMSGTFSRCITEALGLWRVSGEGLKMVFVVTQTFVSVHADDWGNTCVAQ